MSFRWSLFLLLLKLGGHTILYKEDSCHPLTQLMDLKQKINSSLKFTKIQSLSVVVMDDGH